MSQPTTTATNNTNRNRGGARKGRNNRDNRRGAARPVGEPAVTLPAVQAVQKQGTTATATGDNDDNDEDEEDTCYLCTDPVKYYALPECNHRTCHICTLRLRALYKQTTCTFCKEPQASVIYTTSPDKLYTDFDTAQMSLKDAKLAIYFETMEIMEDSLILLQFNCPDEQCDYIGSGFGDLKLHTRSVHNKLLCDLCTRFKKIFAHEQTLYAPAILPLHLPTAPFRGSSSKLSAAPEGLEVHPMCLFCREAFFGDDELFKHMRERHEECFVCKRSGIRDLHFQDYQALEKHFQSSHYACEHPTCLSQKFVVFNTEMDLKAHLVDVHGSDMSSKDKRDARRVHAEFAFEDIGGPSRRGGGGGGGGRDRERENARRAEQEREKERKEREAKEREARARILETGNVHAATPGMSSRRAAFGGQLTTPGASGSGTGSNGATSTPEGRTSTLTDAKEVDPLTLERHAAFLSRVSQLTHNSAAGVAAVKSAIRSYRASESAAKDLVDTFFNVLERDLDATGSLLNSLVDLLDDEDKRSGLLGAWNGFKIEQKRQFPSLIPETAPGGSEYASIASGRVIRVKQKPSNNARGQVWARVESAASSTTPLIRAGPSTAPTSAPAPRIPPAPSGPAFPALTASTAASGSGHKQPQRNTPWASSAAAASSSSPSSTPRPYSVPASSSAPTRQDPGPKPPPTTSHTQFPGLPSSAAAKKGAGVKNFVGGNQSLRNIVGKESPGPAVNPWAATGAGGGGGSQSNGKASGGGAQIKSNGEGSPAPDEEGGNEAPAGAGKKKKKGKEKQMLFTLGSFPT